MPEVVVDVGGRSYRLGCGEGEEQHLRALAARVDGEAANLGEMRQLPEGRLMLMSAIMLADRLSEAEQAAAAAERRAAEAERRAVQAGTMDPEREVEIAA
ncbi:MAG TPA: cell division protein ZapA, partial [Paracoccaceae bacterium]|nr:cell division protein ZapA [Paracoccaceae bacterium]